MSLTVQRLSPGRTLSNTALDVWRSHHTIHGLVEVDVTEPRRRIREIRDATGETLSMTAFILHCLARALVSEPRLNAVVKRGKLYMFDTVNVATMVERELHGDKTVAGLNIRGAERKSLRQIHDEIRAAQTRKIEKVGQLEGMRWLAWTPAWLLRLIVRLTFLWPAQVHRMGGVAGVTAIGMFASGIAWGVPITPNTVMVTVGGIGLRPAVVDGALVEREVLCLTLSFDHAVVDGAPAARFTARLKSLISSAEGLEP